MQINPSTKLSLHPFPEQPDVQPAAQDVRVVHHLCSIDNQEFHAHSLPLSHIKLEQMRAEVSPVDFVTKDRRRRHKSFRLQEDQLASSYECGSHSLHAHPSTRSGRRPKGGWRSRAIRASQSADDSQTHSLPEYPGTRVELQSRRLSRRPPARSPALL